MSQLLRWNSHICMNHWKSSSLSCLAWTLTHPQMWDFHFQRVCYVHVHSQSYQTTSFNDCIDCRSKIILQSVSEWKMHLHWTASTASNVIYFSSEVITVGQGGCLNFISADEELEEERCYNCTPLVINKALSTSESTYSEHFDQRS